MENLEWIAGFFEGEVHFGVHEVTCQKDGRTYGPYVQTRLQVRQIDEDLIRTVRDCLGVGRTSGPYQPKNQNWSPQYEWSTTDRTEIETILVGILPYMHGKRRIAEANRLLTAVRAPRKTDRRTLAKEINEQCT